MKAWPKVALGDLFNIEKGKIGIMAATPGEFPLVTTGEDFASHAFRAALLGRCRLHFFDIRNGSWSRESKTLASHQGLLVFVFSECLD